MDVITAIRNIRSFLKIPHSTRIKVYIKAHSDHLPMLEQFQMYIRHLSGIRDLILQEVMERPIGSATAVLDGMEIYVPLEGLIDLEKECNRLTLDLAKVKEDLTWIERKLSHADFLEKAPEDIIEKERVKFETLRERERKLVEALESIR